MQISDNEVKKVLELRAIASEIAEIGEARTRAEDEALVADVTKQIVNMPDREDRIEELRARIQAGTYNPSGEEIAEAMIRRSIADRLA